MKRWEMYTKDGWKKTKGRDNLKILGVDKWVHVLLKLILEKLHLCYGLDSTFQERVGAAYFFRCGNEPSYSEKAGYFLIRWVCPHILSVNIASCTVPSLFLGNKCDLESLREVEFAEAEAMCEYIPEILYVLEASAKENTNIDDAFMCLATELKVGNYCWSLLLHCWLSPAFDLLL